MTDQLTVFDIAQLTKNVKNNRNASVNEGASAVPPRAYSDERICAESERMLCLSKRCLSERTGIFRRSAALV